MASMLVRNIPDEVMKQIKKRAKAEGKSTAQFVREAIAEKGEPSRDEVLKRIDEIRARSKPVDLETVTRIMDEARDERDASSTLPDFEDDR